MTLTIGFNSAPSSGSGPSSASSHPSISSILETYIERLQAIIKRTNLSLPSKNPLLQKFICPISLDVMKDPVVTKCGHIFDRAAFTEALRRQEQCPTCRTSITNQEISSVYGLKDLIETLENEDCVPILAHFQKENPRLATQSLALAKSYVEEGEYKEAFNVYMKAFLHTNASSDYAAVPALYEKLGDKQKAALAYLHLASYQLQEGKVAEAVATLEHCQSLNPELKISPFLIELDLSLQLSSEIIDKTMRIAAAYEPTEAIAIYKQIITYAPNHFGAYQALCPLLKNRAEKKHFFLLAAHYAMAEGKEELAASFQKEAANLPISTSMSQEAWNSADIRELPPYPPELVAFLAGDCAIWPGEKRSETHIVVPLCPTITKIVDGSCVEVPRTLKSLDELAKSLGLGCRFIWEGILKPEVDKPAEEEFHWAVMTKDILPGSRSTSYEAQPGLVGSKGYEMPGFLDAATAILWENQCSKQRLFSNEPWTYTRCKEKVQDYALIVGGFVPSGLRVDNNSYDYVGIGVAGFRKF